MDSITKQTPVLTGVEPTSTGVRIETNRSDPETMYWGVLCRTCQGLVAFDMAPYVSFGPKASSLKPGAIRCGQGHNHIYFPRDFRFASFVARISDEVMRKNRDVFRAINPYGQRPSHDFVPEAVKPPANPSSDIPVRGLESGKACSAGLGVDPRREAAQLAAKLSWASWASRKVL
jgi:hypothetical protein